MYFSNCCFKLYTSYTSLILSESVYYLFYFTFSVACIFKRDVLLLVTRTSLISVSFVLSEICLQLSLFLYSQFARHSIRPSSLSFILFINKKQKLNTNAKIFVFIHSAYKFFYSARVNWNKYIHWSHSFFMVVEVFWKRFYFLVLSGMQTRLLLYYVVPRSFIKFIVSLYFRVYFQILSLFHTGISVTHSLITFIYLCVLPLSSD